MASDKNVVVNIDLKGLEKILGQMVKVMERTYNLLLERERRYLQERDEDKIRYQKFYEESKKAFIPFEEPVEEDPNVAHIRRQSDNIPLCKYNGDNVDLVTSEDVRVGQEFCSQCLDLLAEGP